MRISDHDKQLKALLRELRPPKEPSANGHALSPARSDEEIIAKARSEKNGKFERLWNGDLSDYGGDHSAADNGFVYKLYFYTQDEEQIRRIHGSSGLARDKSLDRDGYLQYSLDAARENVEKRYDWGKNGLSHSHSLIGNESDESPITDLVQSIKATSLRGLGKPEPRGWIVANQIWENHAACWYGEGGVAKSLLAMHLATHIASPEFNYWLTEIAIKTAPVLCLDFELDRTEQHRRLYEIAQGLGLDDVPENLYYLGATEHPASVMFAAAAEEVKRLGIKLVIVDSVGFAVEGDAEVARDILSFHRNYLEPIKAAGASPLLIDHQAKIMKGEKYSDKTAFGSVYKTNAVRSMFQVRGGKREEGDGITATFRHTKNNFGPKADEFSVDVVFGPGEITVEELDDVVPDPSHEPTIEDRVLHELGVLVEATTADLKAALPGDNPSSVANAVSRLKGDGKIEPLEKKRGNAAVYRLSSHSLPYSESESESPLSAQLAPGESATLDELRAGDADPLGRVVYAGKGGPGFDVYIGRGGRHGHPEHYFANPYKIGEHGPREGVLAQYERYLHSVLLMRDEGREKLEELRGKTLGCWCAGKEGAPEVLSKDDPLHCHGQVLLKALEEVGDPDPLVRMLARRERRKREYQEEVRVNDPARYHEMPADEQERLRAWVRDKVVPQRKPHNSYALKHTAERDIGADVGSRGYYVSNAELKGAMLEAGYMPLDTRRERGINFYFQAGPREDKE